MDFNNKTLTLSYKTTVQDDNSKYCYLLIFCVARQTIQTKNSVIVFWKENYYQFSIWNISFHYNKKVISHERVSTFVSWLFISWQHKISKRKLKTPNFYNMNNPCIQVSFNLREIICILGVICCTLWFWTKTLIKSFRLILRHGYCTYLMWK